MFTGIVEELGEVVGFDVDNDSARIRIRGPLVTAGAARGDSIAINGVCLTVTAVTDGEFTADVMGETLARSSLGGLHAGTAVNLERPLRPDGRLGGHLVQGHVDGTGTIAAIQPAGAWQTVRITIAPELARYVIHKGSVAVDGISLTVSALGDGDREGDPWFEVSLIPETLARTTLGSKQPGEVVNLEVDMIAKYVERLLVGEDVVTGLDGAVLNGAVPLDDVPRAVADIAAGRPVVVVDDIERENEGDIIFAASKATPELLAFAIRYTSGVICAPMTGETLDRLQLPLMTSQNAERMRTAFAITVDARDGVTTGISAADRARTIRTLADSATEPYEIVRPGHVFPLRYTPGGVLRRPGHTEAAVDLARLAGLTPAGVLAEIVNDDGTMARLPRLREFADEHGLTLISIEQLIAYRRQHERVVNRVVETRLPNEFGEWRAVGYQNSVDGTEHLALVLGDLTAPGLDPLVRMHSECLTGDVFGSHRCDCGTQLEAAMAAIAAEGRGAVLYLRGHEGRGIGLLSKLRAYQLQDAGADTVDANTELGLPVDAREYSTGAQMLTDLGIYSLRLLTNNPAKIDGLAGFGITVTGRVSLPSLPTAHNLRYLTAKRDRLGHQIDNLPAIGEVSSGPPASAASLR